MTLFDKKHAEHYMELLPNVNGWGIYHLIEYFKENKLIPDQKVYDRLEELIKKAIQDNLSK